MPSTLAQNYYYKQGALLKHLNSYQTFCNNPDLNRFEEELTDRTVVTLWPAPSKDRLINLIKNEKDSTLLCQKWTSSLDTSTTYISDSHPLGRTFDYFPSGFYKRNIQNYQLAMKYGQFKNIDNVWRYSLRKNWELFIDEHDFMPPQQDSTQLLIPDLDVPQTQ